MDCSECKELIDKEDKYCRYCGLDFDAIISIDVVEEYDLVFSDLAMGIKSNIDKLKLESEK